MSCFFSSFFHNMDCTQVRYCSFQQHMTRQRILQCDQSKCSGGLNDGFCWAALHSRRLSYLQISKRRKSMFVIDGKQMAIERFQVFAGAFWYMYGVSSDELDRLQCLWLQGKTLIRIYDLAIFYTKLGTSKHE